MCGGDDIAALERLRGDSEFARRSFAGQNEPALTALGNGASWLWRDVTCGGGLFLHIVDRGSDSSWISMPSTVSTMSPTVITLVDDDGDLLTALE